MEIVDSHVHVFTKAGGTYHREVGSLATADREGTAEQLLRLMDANGVSRAVLIGMGGHKIEDHRYVRDCVRRWPDRFTSTGLVDISDPDPAARLKELVEVTGIEGIRLGRLGDPSEGLPVYGLFEAAQEMGININIYTSSTQVPLLEPLIRSFPGVTISLDHLGVTPSTPLIPDRWGRPRFDEEPIPPSTYPTILNLSRYPNVCIKISGEYAFSKIPYPYGDMTSMVEQVYRAYGADRMMWATDFPWIVEEPGYDKLIRLIDHHLPGIPKKEREMMMGGTAMGVWFKR